MSEQPITRAFPASKLGAFLRAMEDPEGNGMIEPSREREITSIEQAIASDDLIEAEDDQRR